MLLLLSVIHPQWCSCVYALLLSWWCHRFCWPTKWEQRDTRSAKFLPAALSLNEGGVRALPSPPGWLIRWQEEIKGDGTWAWESEGVRERHRKRVRERERERECPGGQECTAGLCKGILDLTAHMLHAHTHTYWVLTSWKRWGGTGLPPTGHMCDTFYGILPTFQVLWEEGWRWGGVCICGCVLWGKGGVKISRSWQL